VPIGGPMKEKLINFLYTMDECHLSHSSITYDTSGRIEISITVVGCQNPSFINCEPRDITPKEKALIAPKRMLK